MSKPYKHFTSLERDRLAYLNAQGFTHREIGKILKRDHRSIGRELKRNNWGGKYFANVADFQAKIKKKKACKREKLKNTHIQNYVKERLTLKISPVIISSEISSIFPGYSVCHESIYQYIYEEEPDYIPCLARAHIYRRRRRRYHKRRSRLLNRTSIDQRPLEANLRLVFGHWESDSLVGLAHKGFLNVLVERMTRYTIITRLQDITSESTKKALIYRLSGFPQEAIKSITFDNGPENTLHQEISAELKTIAYFCRAYQSWQKGTVENTNGLIRWFLSKKTDITLVSDLELFYIQSWLNHRQRKCLNFNTPYQLFTKQLGALRY